MNSPLLKLFVYFLLLLSLANCSINPFSTDNQLTGNAAGPIIGGVAGAGTAALLGAPKPLIALAGIGGAGIGYYVTTLRFAAGGILKGQGQVYQIGELVTIVIPTDRLFDPNSSELLPEAPPILNSALAVLDRYPDNNILISGNTSGFGTRKRELHLSEERAREVAAFFWAHGNISSFKNQSLQTRKLIYTGYGNYFPIANNIRALSIRENSRIQITSYPSKMDLHLDKCHKVFNNIGDSEGDTPLKGAEQPPIANFSGDLLPDNGGGPTSDDFRDTEHPRTETTGNAKERYFYEENARYKGDSWDDFNSVAPPPPAPHSSYKPSHLKGD